MSPESDDKNPETPKDTPEASAKKTPTRRKAASSAAAVASAAMSSTTESADEEPKAETSKADDAETTTETESQSANADANTSTESTGEPNAWDKTKEAAAKVDWQLRGRHLLRLLLMFLAGAGVSVSVSVLFLLTFVQFIFIMITGDKLATATDFCSRLSIYIKHLLDFICYKSNEPLFPLAPFPESENDDDGVTIDGTAERV